MPHCVSSRYVLSHYSKCKDHVCPVCGPVREAIRRNFERSKEVVKLSSSSTNVARPSEVNGNSNGNGNMQGFTYQGMGGEGDYNMGFGANFGNGFGGNPPNGAPLPEAVPQGPPGTMQKLAGKKQKKEKPEKPEKKEDKEGPPAKKVRVSTSAKAIAAAAASAVSQTGPGGGHPSIPESVAVNINQENTMKAFTPFMAQHPQHGSVPPTSASNSLLAPTSNKPLSIFPLDPVSCALYNFSPDNVNAHFRHIHEGMKITASRIREICMPIIEQIFAVPHAFNIFGWPVDPIQLGIPDYNDVVKVPMDLGTVKRRLETGHYRDLHNFVQDVHLCFDNAMLYNPRNSDVHTLAKSLKREFDNQYKLAITHSEKAIEMSRLNENACLVCGEIGLKFEPPVYYCNGRCGGQRIRRNAFYYTNANNTYHWCNSCFTDLRNDQPIKLPDCTLFKADLGKNKKKHCEDSEEPWVQCDGRHLSPSPISLPLLSITPFYFDCFLFRQSLFAQNSK
jgi:Bromodomain